MGLPLLLKSTVLFDILSFLPSILLVFFQHITTIVQYMPPSSLVSKHYSRNTFLWPQLLLLSFGRAVFS